MCVCVCARERASECCVCESARACVCAGAVCARRVMLMRSDLSTIPDYRDRHISPALTAQRAISAHNVPMEKERESE